LRYPWRTFLDCRDKPDNDERGGLFSRKAAPFSRPSSPPFAGIDWCPRRWNQSRERAAVSGLVANVRLAAMWLGSPHRAGMTVGGSGGHAGI
ncbi:MAG: hypothetical protein ABJN42_11550, partial [Roseibium sp.]|uniref:hypothetical protein n=1 Tax=Roseibium sp. TaxID=1936156 RepID=UPI00329A1FF5